MLLDVYAVHLASSLHPPRYAYRSVNLGINIRIIGINSRVERRAVEIFNFNVHSVCVCVCVCVSIDRKDLQSQIKRQDTILSICSFLFNM